MEKTLSTRMFLMSLKVVSIANRVVGSKFTAPQSVILCYHDVGGSWEFSTSKGQFAKHIKALAEKTKIVSLKDAFSGKKENVSKVALTFDDGYVGVYQNAYPILKKYNSVATVFAVNTKNISTRTGHKANLLNKRQVNALLKAGWTIGFHTTTHADLSTLSNDELRKEIKEGKGSFESKFGIKTKYFAYPYGRYTKLAVKMVKDSGFEAAFTVDGGEAASYENKYTISRVTISKYISEEDLIALVSPLGLLVNRFFTKLWQIKDSLLG
jgi:peptidoglycan/xylan/chitin deacetylase (PgdA/CDA1 family)